MALNDDLIQYYQDKLIAQYRDKPRARAMIRAFARAFLKNQIVLDIQNAFTIDSAIGYQLDVIGKYIGASRNGNTSAGPITLNDSDFKTVLKLKVIQNNSGSSLSEIQDLLHKYFQGVIYVFDFKTMNLGYFFNSSIGGQYLVEFLVRGNYLPKPMGVGFASLLYLPTINNLFGFRTYSNPPQNVHGYNTYYQYDTGCPYLHYTDAASL